MQTWPLGAGGGAGDGLAAVVGHRPRPPHKPAHGVALSGAQQVLLGEADVPRRWRSRHGAPHKTVCLQLLMALPHGLRAASRGHRVRNVAVASVAGARQRGRLPSDSGSPPQSSAGAAVGGDGTALVRRTASAMGHAATLVRRGVAGVVGPAVAGAVTDRAAVVADVAAAVLAPGRDQECSRLQACRRRAKEMTPPSANLVALGAAVVAAHRRRRRSPRRHLASPPRFPWFPALSSLVTLLEPGDGRARRDGRCAADGGEGPGRGRPACDCHGSPPCFRKRLRTQRAEAWERRRTSPGPCRSEKRPGS